MPSSSVNSTPDRGRAGWQERVAALAIQALVAVAATWPLAWRPRALLGAPQGEGDPYLNLFTLGWDLQQLFAAPSSWLNGRVFEAPIFHPARQAEYHLRSYFTRMARHLDLAAMGFDYFSRDREA